MAPEPDHRSAAESRFAGVFAHLGLITAYAGCGSDSRYFAIVIPQNRPGFRLATLDAAGRVLVTDRFDAGH